MRRFLIVLTAALCGTVASLLPAGVGSSAGHDSVVGENPVNSTPHVLDGIVNSIAVLSDTVVVGGAFSRAREATGTAESARHNLLAYRRASGTLSPGFAPVLNGPVLAVAPGPDDTVYVGGSFTTVNGRPQSGLARLRVSDGSLVTGQGGAEGGEVRTLASDGEWLYVGGSFTRIAGVDRTALARLDARTGRVDPGLDLGIAAASSGRLRVEKMELSADANRLVVIGTFTRVAGQRRHHIALVDTSPRIPRLTAWSTTAYVPRCHPDFDTYLRGVSFSPDGSYFVVVTTGRMTSPDLLCNTAARWETAPGNAGARPTWINHTGGDSLYAVEVTPAAVYVGGHQRWMDNPHGDGTAGPGAVAREGISAVHPVTGRALAWNPTRSRGVGVQSLVAVREGLLVGSDTDRLGREYHGRVGMFPTTG